ncbi:hypothetical protein POUND7_019027, partial [Theobroma cacao]
KPWPYSIKCQNVMSGLMHGHDVEGARRVFEGKLGGRVFYEWNVGGRVEGFSGDARERCYILELEMPVKDVGAWNAMLEAYVGFECVDKAVILFQEMPEKDLNSWKLFFWKFNNIFISEGNYTKIQICNGYKGRVTDQIRIIATKTVAPICACINRYPGLPWRFQ